MASSNRADRFDHLFKALRKHYKPIVDPTDRRVLDCLLYACCLEDASHEAADEAFAKLQQTYFDANEIRVTTVAELSESLTSLPKASAAAGRLKKSLQSLFEARYSFDIDDLKKANLGKAIEEVAAWDGTSKFVMAYVTQHAFGGHSIPVDNQILSVCVALELLTTAEANKGVLPGIERAIPKNKGMEFASLLHQFAVEYATDFHHPVVNSIFKEMGAVNKVRVSFVAPLPTKEPEKAPLAGTAQHLEATNAKAKADKQAAAAAALPATVTPPAAKSTSKTSAKQEPSTAAPSKPSKPSKMAAVSDKINTLTPKEAAQKEKASAKKAESVAPAKKKGDPKTTTKADAKPASKSEKSSTTAKTAAPTKAKNTKTSDKKAVAPKAPAKVAEAKPKSGKATTTSKNAKAAPATPPPTKPVSSDKPKKKVEPPKPATGTKKGTSAKQLPVKAVTKKNTKPR